MNIDWHLLREQKLWLLSHDCPEADGLVHLLDAIQDYEVDNGNATELEVFGRDLTADQPNPEHEYSFTILIFKTKEDYVAYWGTIPGTATEELGGYIVLEDAVAEAKEWLISDNYRVQVFVYGEHPTWDSHEKVFDSEGTEMKIKTSELIGDALNWAVHTTLIGAPCEGYAEHEYATDWSQGGPIIERECIDIAAYGACSAVPKNPEYWEARVNMADGEVTATGPTPLIAAMRCYVSSCLGNEVDVPEGPEGVPDPEQEGDDGTEDHDTNDRNPNRDGSNAITNMTLCIPTDPQQTSQDFFAWADTGELIPLGNCDGHCSAFDKSDEVCPNATWVFSREGIREFIDELKSVVPEELL